MKSIFDKQISLYRNITDTIGGSTVTLRQFLFSDKHKAQIERLRCVEDEDKSKKMKLQLPVATISGLFSYRDGKHLVEHSGLICIDIDAKDNPDMDVEQTKQQLAEFDVVAYAGLSVRGKGLFCIIPIAYPDKHEEHFLALQADFKEMGIVIDPQCGDISRARVVSYDPNPFVNESAKTYKFTKRKPQPPVRHYSHNDSVETVRKVYELCQTIQDLNLDITNGYDNWKDVGFSLASLGEDGREAFHIVSRIYSKYDPVETDRKFDNFLNTMRSFTIGTFFYICKDYGL